MQQHTLHIAGGVARNPLVRLSNPVTLDFLDGEHIAIVGPNGAGKSTLIGVLAKTVTPDSGNVSVLGYDIRRDWQQFKMAIGIVPQEITFDPFLSVWETLRLQSGYFGLRHNDKWLNELLEVLDLADKKKASCACPAV